MIGSFWNLCRACPSMPVDKLHSEYRSTYRWHEYTGGSRPEVIRKPPIANQFASSTDHFFSKSADEERHVEGTINEPPLPRRKKCPELAYKTHEFIACDQQQQQQPLKNEFNSANRARSEERTGTPSRRSKSEGPPRIPNGNAYVFRDAIDPVTGEKTEHAGRQAAGESSGLFKKTITKLSTEYRLQFVWPHTRKDTNHNQCTDDAVDFPKKSLSMGAIKATQSNAMPTVHKKRTTHEKEATVQELEPLFNNAEEKKEPRSRSNIRPFSQYGINEGKYRQNTTEKENFGFCDEKIDKIDNKTLTNGIDSKNVSWYKDVIELRKKAGEYKHRGWGVEIQPDLYNKQKELWDQVSRRSSLSALSLASTVHKPISKEEKDKENNKKTSPSKGYGRYQNIRHHLERTTGADVEEGALLPSPTREKLLPTIPKSKDDESYNSQRGSPKKGSTSKHGSPQKSPKKMLKQARSQSVGPTVPAAAASTTTTTTTDGSPKRRTGSSATTAAGTPSSVSNTAIIKTHKKTPASTPTMADRRPRPNEDDIYKDGGGGGTSISSASPIPMPHEITEHIVKSPPEPTRVKSPEQILMRSPDPVNWTVPLDTGKTFTVTQNVRDGILGESIMRPQSEFKVSTSCEKPPPAPQSAPPELAEQANMEAWKNEQEPIENLDIKNQLSTGITSTIDHPITTATVSDPATTNTTSTVAATAVPEVRFDKPVPGTTLRCLDDPNFDPEINSPGSVGNRTISSDVLEKARDRFDRFWGGNKEENV